MMDRTCMPNSVQLQPIVALWEKVGPVSQTFPLLQEKREVQVFVCVKYINF